MDPFEVRMQFLSHLRRLNATQQSIQKVVTYAIKYFSRCGEDLWDCLVEECQKGNTNTRINLLYLLDSLCETSLLTKVNTHAPTSFYVDFVARDLGKIVEYVVPEGRDGLPNLMSTVQILDNWRIKRIIDPQIVDEILTSLDSRRASVQNGMGDDADIPPPASANDSSSTFSRNEVFRRIEEDRERHKRLRERRWVQPISYSNQPHQVASLVPLPENEGGSSELAIDIEFENEWETTSDWNEDDDEAIAEENNLCYSNFSERMRLRKTP